MSAYDGKAANSLQTQDPAKAVLDLWLGGNNNANALLVRNANGTIVDAIPSPGVAPTQAVASTTAINIGVGSLQRFWKTYPLSSASSTVGAILAPGLFDGQQVTLINLEASNSVTFDSTPATSRVVVASYALLATQAATFTWVASTGRWYPHRVSNV